MLLVVQLYNTLNRKTEDLINGDCDVCTPIIAVFLVILYIALGIPIDILLILLVYIPFVFLPNQVRSVWDFTTIFFSRFVFVLSAGAIYVWNKRLFSWTMKEANDEKPPSYEENV